MSVNPEDYKALIKKGTRLSSKRYQAAQKIE